MWQFTLSLWPFCDLGHVRLQKIMVAHAGGPKLNVPPSMLATSRLSFRNVYSEVEISFVWLVAAYVAICWASQMVLDSFFFWVVGGKPQKWMDSGWIGEMQESSLEKVAHRCFGCGLRAGAVWNRNDCWRFSSLAVHGFKNEGPCSRCGCRDFAKGHFGMAAEFATASLTGRNCMKLGCFRQFLESFNLKSNIRRRIWWSFLGSIAFAWLVFTAIKAGLDEVEERWKGFKHCGLGWLHDSLV